MTYAERIERVKRALMETCAISEDGIGWDELARAADRMVLEAIREPTEEMSIAGRRANAYLAAPSGSILHTTAIYQAMHAAIPRGEDT